MNKSSSRSRNGTESCRRWNCNTIGTVNGLMRANERAEHRVSSNRRERTRKKAQRMFVRVDGGYLVVFGWHNEDNRPEEQKRTLFGFLSKKENFYAKRNPL